MNDPKTMQEVTEAERRVGVVIEFELKLLTKAQQHELIRRVAKLLPLLDPGEQNVAQPTRAKK